MTTLKSSLKDSDSAVLGVIAQFWGIKDPVKIGANELPNAIYTAMTDPAQAEIAWHKLDDKQRGALQLLLSSDNKMTVPQFERVYGEIRKMGVGAIEREKPLENPSSTAESLYYRGLIYDKYENSPTGMRPIVYIPPELVESLPYHHTTYDTLESETEAKPSASDHHALTLEALKPDEVEGVQPADTTIVDDMTALLAYLQVHGGEITSEGDLSVDDRKALMPQLLQKDETRLTFVFKLALSAELIGAQSKHISPRRAEAKRWLESERAAQLQRLVSAWRVSTVYRDLWHVPGLFPEPAGWPYDPTVGRESVSEFLRDFAPAQAWWSPDAFITIVKETEPDFQRPAGDYDSWYIRNTDGEYLTGFESWDAVEGSLLLFLLTGPMHWLGMMDVSDDAVRLTAYGRSFIGLEKWPEPAPVQASIQVKENGMLLISRRVSRIDRFQAMRFTTWGDPGDGSPYTYMLDAQGIQQADLQGINVGHITAFLSRMLGTEPIPKPIAHLLETWQTGPSANVTLEKMIVLRTTAPETMDSIVNNPALRRYLGARLGEMAVAVRSDQWEALQEALGAHGVDVDVRKP